MVSAPSGLLTCLQRFSAWRTWLRLVSSWALGLGLVFIALRTAVASDHTILVFGDSLSAAYGIRPEQGWVALLTQRLHSQGYGYQIVNASVSGETTSGGVERLPRSWQLHLLEKVALDPTRMQADGMHPNASGEPPILDTVWPHLKPLLNKNR